MVLHVLFVRVKFQVTANQFCGLFLSELLLGMIAMVAAQHWHFTGSEEPANERPLFVDRAPVTGTSIRTHGAPGDHILVDQVCYRVRSLGQLWRNSLFFPGCRDRPAAIGAALTAFELGDLGVELRQFASFLLWFHAFD